jgi:hypothetical protein
VFKWELNVDKQEEADHMLLIGWNLTAMSKADDARAGKLCSEVETKRAHQGEECIPAYVE